MATAVTVTKSQHTTAATWARARDLWLASRKTENTRRAYARALDDLLEAAGKAPWEIEREDVVAWVDGGHRRGLSDATLAQRTAGVMSFYRFVCDEYRPGRPLLPYNPTAGKSLRPAVNPFGKSHGLTTEEARALIRAIPTDTIRGLRDYALILGYLMNGRRNSEWRQARWGDFETRSGHVYFRWSGKNKFDQLLEIAQPIFDAVMCYLRADGRMQGVREDDYIFRALTDHARRLPNVKRAEINRPLSDKEVGRIVKKYAKRAGLNPARVHVHMLRHTAALLRREAGDNLEKIQQFLGHSSPTTTLVYLHSLEGQTDSSWGTVANLLGLVKTNGGTNGRRTN